MSDEVRKNSLNIKIILIAAAIASTSAAFLFLLPRGNPSPTEQLQLPEEFLDWALVVDGLVEEPLNLSISDLLSMPSSSVNAPLYCVGDPTDPVENGTWEGARLNLVLEKAKIRPHAIKVAFYAPDGFTTDLTIQDAEKDNVVIAYKKDGEFLKAPDGSPALRLVVPGKWGYKWIRQLNHIELVDYDFKGRYERAGYSDEADIEEGSIGNPGMSNPPPT